MSMNKGTLDAYRKIVTKDIEARNLTLTGSINAGGNIITTGSISGSSINALYIILNSGSITNLSGSQASFSGNLYVDETGSFKVLWVGENGKVRINKDGLGNIIGFGGTEYNGSNPIIYSDEVFLALTCVTGSRIYFNYDNVDTGSAVDFFNGKTTVSSSGDISSKGNIITTGSISGSNLYGYSKLNSESGAIDYIIVIDGLEFVLGSVMGF